MFKRPYDPCGLCVGLINSIDPKIAAGYANYERNYRLLSPAKTVSVWAVLAVILGLWFLTCFFLVKSKQRSYGWLPLAMFGPFGLIILNMLRDKAPTPADLYQQFEGSLRARNIVRLQGGDGVGQGRPNSLDAGDLEALSLRERLTRALCEDQHCDNSKADLANFLPS